MEAVNKIQVAPADNSAGEKVEKQAFVLRNVLRNVLRVLVLAGLSLAFFVGNYFLESRAETEVPIVEQKISTNESGSLTRILGGATLFSEAEISFNKVEENLVATLSDGRYWANFRIYEDEFNLLSRNVVLIPEKAQFEVLIEDDVFELKVFEGDVYLGFLEEGIEPAQLVGKYDPLYMNSFLVPRGNKVTFQFRKIDTKIKPLLPSKLAKELRYTPLTASDRGDEWVKENLKRDSKFIEEQNQQLTAEFFDQGEKVGDGVLARFAYWAEENLAFVPQKKEAILLDHTFNYLDDAIYFAVSSQAEQSELELEQFFTKLALLPEDLTNSTEFKTRYYSYFLKLNSFPADSQAKVVLDKLIQRGFVEGFSYEELLKFAWQNVYRGMDANVLLAEQSLTNYYQYLDKTFGKFEDLTRYRLDIAYQNKLFDNIFSTPIFYKEAYFKMKSALEKEILAVYEEGSLKDQLKQDFINDKIDYLKNLTNFFFEEEISVEEAKRILSLLVEEVDDLMPADSNSTAVVQLFEKELDELDDFWGYLNSPEYYSSKTYGLTHKERYRSYLSERDKIWSFINIQEDVLGERVEEDGDLKDVKDSILAALAEVPGLLNVSISGLENTTQRYVQIEAVIGSYPFSAQYDRDLGFVDDVYAYGELVSDRPVKFESLREVLASRFSDLADDQVLPDDVTEETHAERSLKIYLVGVFEDLGFILKESDVQIVDKDKAIYRIEKIKHEDYPEVEVTFDYIASRETANNLYILANGNPVVLDGEYTFEELLDTIIAQDKIQNQQKVSR